MHACLVGHNHVSTWMLREFKPILCALLVQIQGVGLYCQVFLDTCQSALQSTKSVPKLTKLTDLFDVQKIMMNNQDCMIII